MYELNKFLEQLNGIRAGLSAENIDVDSLNNDLDLIKEGIEEVYESHKTLDSVNKELDMSNQKLKAYNNKLILQLPDDTNDNDENTPKQKSKEETKSFDDFAKEFLK